MDREILIQGLFANIAELELTCRNLDSIRQDLNIESCWVKKVDSGLYWYECDSCGEKPLYDQYGNIRFSNYCPYCGAAMADEIEGEEDD